MLEDMVWREVNRQTINPKDVAAQTEGRAPLDYSEPYAEECIARVLALGSEKYGRRNYTVAEIGIATYIAAIRRHLNAIVRGEWLDSDTGQPHIAHVGANVHVILGAHEADTLQRDIVAEVKHAPGLDPRQSVDETEWRDPDFPIASAVAIEHAHAPEQDEFIPRGALAALPPKFRA